MNVDVIQLNGLKGFSMVNKLGFIFLIASIVAPPVSAQTDSWDDSLVSRHSIAIINVNVSRLFDSYSESKSLERFVEHCKKRHSLVLSTVDQFQMVFSNDPKLEFGADSTSNTKLVFKNPTKIDASVAGKLTGYALAEDSYGKQAVYVSKRDGFWGAMRKNDRSIVMGVPRMLRSIIESQESSLSPVHEISKLEKTNVDLCATVSGGESAAQFAKSLFGSDKFTKPFRSFSSAVIYLDTKSENAIRAEFETNSSDQAKVFITELSELTDSGKK